MDARRARALSAPVCVFSHSEATSVKVFSPGIWWFGSRLRYSPFRTISVMVAVGGV
jgi:hypothetical protein